ncbi:MAG TPA: DUF6580 family putative transport protein [Candidatus Didemnitutus sp.]|nr:DUF6580 family putative transport protein [Candidatus Didemnitutus sp.]
MYIAAVIFVLLAVLGRILPTMDLTLSNLLPFTSIAFCGAVYFRKPWLAVFSFVALELSDLYINWFYARQYGFHWPISGFVVRSLCFGTSILIGRWIAGHKSWLWLLNGSLLGAVLFYIITNTQSWFGDAFYAKTLAGWWQALTVGHPEYPPTIYFFRNTLFGDLMFTGLFAGVMELILHRSGEPSLLDKEREEEAGDEEPVEVEAENKE